MGNIPYEWVNDWQDAQSLYPDQPMVLVYFRRTGDVYMRYHGEFHKIDSGPYGVSGRPGRPARWCIAGVMFTPDTIVWMIDNSIALPLNAEDLVLYQLTWDIVHG